MIQVLWYQENRFGEEASKMLNANQLGFYLWKRINQDQDRYRKTRPKNIRGLYFNQSDLNILEITTTMEWIGMIQVKKNQRGKTIGMKKMLMYKNHRESA